ncbi:MAG: hypothetical protein CVT49_06545 [candidate division Zixibacteria bacterium HGW-Zixibacteria-1]|nr:MAG: hypothetical protein CVT49_06545 [candidate division Zixibacteria bacterium HGW-Zixibacteria-1]
MKLRYRILLSIPITALVFIVTFYLAVFQFNLIEYMANRELANRIGDNLPMRVHIGEISGDYISRLYLKDIWVIYEDSLTTYTMAHIPELFAQYSVRQFWMGHIEFKKIYIDSAEFTLRQSPDKKWLIPRLLKASQQKKDMFDFNVNDVGLNNLKLNLIRADDSLTFSNIILKASIAGSQKTYSAQIQGLNFRSSDSRFNLLSADGSITLTGDQLMFQDVQIRTDSSDVTLGGMIVIDKRLQTEFELNARKLNIRELSQFIKANLDGNVTASGKMHYSDGSIDGAISLSGTFMNRYFDSLFGTFTFAENRLHFDTLEGVVLNGCAITGKGNIDFSVKPEKYDLLATIDGFNLNNLVFDSYRSNLSGDLNLSGRGFTSRDMVLDIVVNLDESWFDEYHAYKVIGDMIITTDSLNLRDKFAVKYHDNTFIAEGKLDYTGPVSLTGTASFKDLSAFNGQTFIEEMGGRGDAAFDVSGELNNPDIRGFFKSDSVWIYGIHSSEAIIDFDITHFLYDRDGYVNTHLFRGAAYDVPYDTIFLQMHLDSQYVFIDSSELCNEYANLGGYGTLDYLSYPQLLTIDDVAVTLMGLPLRNDGYVLIDIDSTGYDIKNCRLVRPVGYIDGKGRINYDESMDFKLSGAGIQIEPWVKLINKEYGLRGSISGELDLAGTFLEPELKFTGGIDTLTYQDLWLGDLCLCFDYKDELIDIDSIALRSEKGYYKAEGVYPINLAFTEIDDRFPDRDQDIRIQAYDQELNLVSRIIYEVERFAGTFNADFRLTGTPRTPHIDGTATIRNGVLKPYDLVDSLQNLYADIKMVNQTIFIDSVSGICTNGKKSGTVNAHGEVIIKSIDAFDYNVNVSARDFPVKYELGDIEALAETADFKILGVTPPIVYGDIKTRSVAYRENFAEEDEGWILLSALEGENTWDLNINLEAVSNLWIKNADIDAEFGGNLNLIRENGIYRFIGSMEILRGNGFLAGRTFRVEPGGLISYEDIEYPNPMLDIYATTKIRGMAPDQSGEASTTTDLELRIHVTGTLDEPNIATAEGSQFSTEELLTLLVLDDNQQNPDVGSVSSTAFGFMSSQFGRIGAKTLGVETFEIDPVYGDKVTPLGTKLTLGAYALPNLYIYGSQYLSDNPGLIGAGFEYRLKRFLLLEGRGDEGDLYQLFLNFYWDY